MGVSNTEGNIAVWLGSFKDKECFEEYKKVHYEYDDAVEDIDSQFEKDFGLKYYDRDIVEFNFLNDANNTLRALFTGSSYLDEYINGLNDKNELNYNVIIRVYDYKYVGEKKCSNYKENSLEFYDNIAYEKDIDLSWMGL